MQTLRSNPDDQVATLGIKNLSVAYGNRQVLQCISFETIQTGITVVMGPAGVGKSTLLRAVSLGPSENSSIRISGTITYCGKPLSKQHHPYIVRQKLGLAHRTVLENLTDSLPHRSDLSRSEQEDSVTQALEPWDCEDIAQSLDMPLIDLPPPAQRRVAILAGALSAEAVLLLDEPGAGLDDASAKRVTKLIKKLSESRAVVVTTHHQARARALRGTVIFLVAGMVEETAPATTFFDNPKSLESKHFLKTGGTRTTRLTPMSWPASKTHDPAMPQNIGAFRGPNGFRWLIPGVLGGTPRPGLTQRIEDDVAALLRMGVSLLVTLEEQVPFDIEPFINSRIGHMWFPIDDMKAPDPIKTVAFLETIRRQIDSRQTVAFHCRAGLGRTGVMLGAYLIHGGEHHTTALQRLRKINPDWVQSMEQERFLKKFRAYLTNKQERPTTILGVDEQ